MATLKELRIRLKSLKNTKKITAAMKMVSAAKLKRAKEASESAKPYINSLSDVLGRLSSSNQNIQNPLLESREVKHVHYIVFSSDRGLCGGFNNNLIKVFYKNLKDVDYNFSVSIVGKKANDQIKKTKMDITGFYPGMASKFSFQNAQELSDEASAKFIKGEYDKVVLVYNQFKSTINQTPTQFQLLPFENIKEEKAVSESISEAPDYIFEPNQASLINDILPKHISIQVFQAMLDNSAGEHAARMTAMENATNNANDYIDSLSIQMNRARQAAITTELTEIVSGAESLNN